MPGFQFLDHEWLTDISMAWLYPLIKEYGLALIFAFISASSFFIVIYPFRKWTIVIPLVLALTTALSFTGIRPQVITWMMFSVIITFIFIRIVFRIII
jgi:hypothetical protein